MSAWRCICSHMALFSTACNSAASKTSSKLCIITLEISSFHLMHSSLFCHKVMSTFFFKDVCLCVSLWSINILSIWYFYSSFVDRVQALPSISALKFNGSLTMAVGTSTGQVNQKHSVMFWARNFKKRDMFFFFSMMAVCSSWTPVLFACLSLVLHSHSVCCCCKLSAAHTLWNSSASVTSVTLPLWVYCSCCFWRSQLGWI